MYQRCYNAVPPRCSKKIQLKPLVAQVTTMRDELVFVEIGQLGMTVNGVLKLIKK
jgi:hypothetical protein